MALSDAEYDELLKLAAQAERLPQSQIGAALKSGGHGYLSDLGHLLASAGLPTQEFAERRAEDADFYRRNAPGVTTFGDYMDSPDGSFLDYLTFLLGSSAPYIAEIGTGAGLAGFAGRGAARALTRGATSETAKLAAQKAASTEASKRALLGGAAASYPSSVGALLGEQFDESGEYDQGMAAALGVPYAGLNVLGGEAALLKALTGTGELRNRGVKNLVKHTLGTGVATGAKEGAAEVGQEALGLAGQLRVNPDVSFTDDAALNRYFEAFAGGASLGGAMGGAAAPFGGTVEGERERVERAEAADRAAQDRLLAQNGALAALRGPAEEGALARLAALQDEEMGLPDVAPSAPPTPPVRFESTLDMLRRINERDAINVGAQKAAARGTDQGAFNDAVLQYTQSMQESGQEPDPMVIARLEEFFTSDQPRRAQLLSDWSGNPGRTFVNDEEMLRVRQQEDVPVRAARDAAAYSLVEQLATHGQYPTVTAAMDRATRPAVPTAGGVLDSIREANVNERQRVAESDPFGGLPMPGFLRTIADMMKDDAKARQPALDRRVERQAERESKRRDFIEKLIDRHAPAAVRGPADLARRIRNDPEFKRQSRDLNQEELDLIAAARNSIQALSTVPDPTVANEMDAGALGIREKGTRQAKDAAAKEAADERKRPQFELGEKKELPTVEEGTRPTFEAGPAGKEKQGELFTKRGQPTKAATVKETQDERQETLPAGQEEANAGQEAQADAVSEVAPEAPAAPAVPVVDKPAPKRRPLKGDMAKVAENWNDQWADKHQFENLAPALQKEWKGLIDNNRATIEAANRIEGEQDLINRGEPTTEETTQETEDAVQEREATTVDVGEQAGDGRTVGEGGAGAPAPKRKARAGKAEGSAETQKSLDERIADLEARVAEKEADNLPVPEQLQKTLDDLIVQRTREQKRARGETEAATPVETRKGEVEVEIPGFGKARQVKWEFGNTPDLNTEPDAHIENYLFQQAKKKKEPTALGLLDTVIKFSKDRSMRDIAERLKELVKSTAVLDLNVDFLTTRDGLVAGEYNAAYDYVTLSRSGRTEHTVMHELVHAATVALMRLAREAKGMKPDERTKDDKALIENYDNLVSVFEYAKSRFKNADDIRGFHDIFEFVSEIHSNRKFRQRLENMPAHPGPLAPSLLQRVWKFISRMLGLEPNLLERATLAADPFFSSVRSYGVLQGGDADIFANALTGPLHAIGERMLPIAGYGFPGLRALGEGIHGIKTGGIGVARDIDAKGNQSMSRPRAEQNVSEGWRKVKQATRDLLAHVTTTQFRASVSAGFSHIHDLINSGQNTTRWVRSVLNNMMAPVFANASDTELNEISSMMVLTTTSKMEAFNNDSDKIYGDWWDKDISTPDRVDDYLYHPREELSKMGVFTAKEFAEGIKHPQTGKLIKFPGMTEDSVMYKKYKAAMDALQHGAIILYHSKVSEADHISARGIHGEIEGITNDIEKRVLYMNFVERAANAHFDLMFKNAKLKDGHAQVQESDEKAAKDYMEQLFGVFTGNATEAQLEAIAGPIVDSRIARAKVDLMNRGMTEADFDTEGVTQQVINNIRAAADAFAKEGLDKGKAQALRAAAVQRSILGRAVIEAKLYAIKSIAGGYVPMNRSGRFNISAEFVTVGADGTKGAALTREDLEDQVYSLLPVVHSDHVNNYLTPFAEQMQAEFDKMEPFEVTLKGSDEKVRVVPRMKQYKDTNGNPTYIAEVASGSASSRINYLAVLQTLESIGTHVSVKERENLIKKMTAADAVVRHNLQRLGHPGYDPDYVTAVSQHLNGVAALVGKRSVEPYLQSALHNKELWGTGEKEIAAAQEIYDSITDKSSPEARIAHRRLTQLKRAYSGQSAERKASIKTQAEELVKFYNDELGYDLDDTSFRKLRSATAVLGLGLDVAKAFTNLSSIPLHAFSALATYNPETGFGGGFGAKQSSAALIRAFKTLSPYIKKGISRMLDEGAESAESMFRDFAEKADAAADGKHLGYTSDAWRFMLRETERGGLKPQAYNAMMGNAKQDAYGSTWDRFSSRAMAMFSTAEEMNRMTTALAAYDLYYDEAIRAGQEDFDATRYAETQSDYIVRFSQGDYSAVNRPRLFRGGVGSLIFMYKTFAVTTVELLRNLSPQGRAIFLGMLWTVSGAAGIPFWEELMAMIDGVAQNTGLGRSITKGNAEREFRRFLQNLGKSVGVPLDKVVMHGILDTATGINVGGRMGVQVGVPLIGLAREGTEWEKELGKALGAPVGMIGGTVRATGDVFAGDFHRFMKDQPVAGVRNIYDAYTYAKTGTVLNKRGQRVVDANGLDVVARAVGYYPQDFKEANDIVRLEEYTRAFSKQVTAQFVEDYRYAAVIGDTEAMREIRQEVAEHNRLYRGTSLEIEDFGKKAIRAGKEAKLSLTERAKKSLSKSQRQDYYAADLQ